MKKLIILCLMMILSCGVLTACGSDPMIVQETKTGMNLEDKARDLTDQQGDEAEENDKNLETPAE
ncbi:MAG TPA: hypothetical protein DEO83_07410 [Lachnospiraceae bacterium]|nr:hypothetical protein [Lachnospiraceae bacterium]